MIKFKMLKPGFVIKPYLISFFRGERGGGGRDWIFVLYDYGPNGLYFSLLGW